MRAAALLGIAPILTALSCKTEASGPGELTRAECVAVVRHQQSLEASDTGGLDDVLAPSLRAAVEECQRTGTQSAYRCVMQAEKKSDLNSCSVLFK